jgi:heat shock 70kDa protein 1/2/6/8
LAFARFAGLAGYGLSEPCGAEAQIAAKLDKEDLEKVEKHVSDTISWLDENTLAEVEELEHKLKELESICSPIIAKVYSAEGGDIPGGFPGAGAAPPPSSGSSAGPKIEEVD